MAVELVKQPWVRAISWSRIDADAINAFAEGHGFIYTPEQAQAPIWRIWRECENYPESKSLDLLSEFAGRFCYRSFEKGRESSDYIENILSERHGSVFAHGNVSFAITGVSRSLTHELIRHHVGTNVSQESQRYVTIEGGEIEVVGCMATRAVIPPLILKLHEDGYEWALCDFRKSFASALHQYNSWIAELPGRRTLDKFDGETMRKKRINEASRAFLPNCVETRLVWTMNMRAARNIIEQRGAESADLEIRRLAVEFTRELKRLSPLSFQDAEIYLARDGFQAVKVKHSKV